MAGNQPNPRLTVEEMQRRFNDGKYWERMQSGEFTEVITKVHRNTAYPEVLERHPGCESVTAQYRQNDNTIVEVHYFRMPDGSVIPNKRPDPKLLFEDGVMYHQEKKRDRAKRLSEEALHKNDEGPPN